MLMVASAAISMSWVRNDPPPHLTPKTFPRTRKAWVPTRTPSNRKTPPSDRDLNTRAEAESVNRAPPALNRAQRRWTPTASSSKTARASR